MCAYDLKPPTLKFITSTKYSISLEWVLDESDQSKENLVFQLELKDPTKGWVTKYWGHKLQTVVKGLAAEDVYHFRVGVSISVDDPYTWSETISTATQDDFENVVFLHQAVNLNNVKGVKEYLTKRISAIDVYNKHGETSLMIATKKGHNECVKVLIDAGADVNIKAEFTWRTALMNACYFGNKIGATMLVDAGADWSLTDRSGCTALHNAIDGNKLEMVIYALECGSDIDAQDNYGWTPLIRSVLLCAQMEILRELDNRKCNIFLKDNHDRNCLEIAKLVGNLPATQVLEEIFNQNEEYLAKLKEGSYVTFESTVEVHENVENAESHQEDLGEELETTGTKSSLIQLLKQ